MRLVQAGPQGAGHRVVADAMTYVDPTEPALVVIARTTQEAVVVNLEDLR